MSGPVSRYDPGVMERVVHTRQTRLNQLQYVPEYIDGYIAVRESSEIGRIWMVRPKGTTKWYKMLVVDSSSKKDGSYYWMKNNHIPLELDYNSYIKFYGSKFKPHAKIEVGRFDKNVFNFLRGEYLNEAECFRPSTNVTQVLACGFCSSSNPSFQLYPKLSKRRVGVY